MPLDDLERAQYEQALLELRTLQRVAEELSRSLDLDVVLDSCLALALEAAHADAGSIFLYDAQRQLFHRTATRDLPEDAAPPVVPRGRLLEMLSGSSVEFGLSLDAGADTGRAAYRDGLRHVLLLALRAEHIGPDLLGFVAVCFRESRPVPPTTIRTLEAIARLESAAIVNARAHRAVERRGGLANGLRELCECILSCTDHGQLCKVILETAVRLTGSNRGLISRVEGDHLHVVAGLAGDERLVGTRYRLDTPYVMDGLGDYRTRVFETTEGFDPKSEVGRLLRQLGTKAFMIAGMRHGGKTIGTLAVASDRERHFEEDEREAMQIIAAVGGEAMERMQALDRLAGEKRRLDAVLEHLPIGVSVISASGEALHINAAAREFGEWLGGISDWRETVSRIQTFDREGQPVPREELLIMKAFRGESAAPRELTIVTPDGKRKRHVLAMAAPVRAPDGKVEAVVSSQQDVTALRELADAKDHFLRIASHELRSPLTSLRATTSLLEMDPSAIDNPERRTLLLERVQRQTARLTRLVEQLIDSVRLNATEPPLERVETDLVELCKDVIAALPDGTRVKLEGDAEVHGVWDGPRLEQVLSNLLSNAARYSSQEITLRVRARDHHAIVEVIDRGIGIPDDVRERLFTPFFRAPNAAAQSKGGLGLGLHIAHEIVRRHGGSLTVTSELGRGSTFVVDLPVDTKPPPG